MGRPPSSTPTELELLILQTLWRIGPGTVRQVRDALAEARPLAYTSVQTTMTTMVRKGLLRRRMVEGAGVFAVVEPEAATRGSMLRDLLRRAFGGSPTALVQHLLEADELDAEELSRIRKLLDDRPSPTSTDRPTATSATPAKPGRAIRKGK